jgi:anti-anti-sigma factor
MAIDFTDVTDNLRHIRISERLDIAGTAEIEGQLAELGASAPRHVILDLTQVTFLGSIGIRAIIGNAQLLQKCGGRMVMLVAENTPVSKTLDATGVDALIPIFTEIADAKSAFLA